MATLKKKDDTMVRCNACGATDAGDGDRFHRFILPHAQNCGPVQGPVAEKFSWLQKPAGLGTPAAASPKPERLTFGARADTNTSLDGVPLRAARKK
jgi:hypothetical protein